MRKQRLFFAAPLGIAALTFLLLTCRNPDLDPIFFALENAPNIVDERGMGDDYRVFDLVYDTGSDRYFAAAGTVYWRKQALAAEPVPTPKWKSLAPPVSGALCNHLVTFNGDIVAWFYNASNGTPAGLYRLVDPSADPPVWNAVPISTPITPSGLSVLRVVNAQLFVALEHFDDPDYVHRLYSVNAAYIFTQVSLPGPEAPDVATMIIDVEYDSADAVDPYWVATLPDPDNSLKYLYSGLLGSLADAASPPAMSVLRPPGALFFASDSRLYLSSENGKIYFRPSGGAWSAWDGVDPPNPADPVKVNDDTVRFTRFVEADGGSLFVGTKGQGYFEFVLGAANKSADLTRRPEYTYRGLRDAVVLSFLRDPAGDPGDGDPAIFACTYGNGLWRADYDSSGPELWPWVQE